MCNFDIGSISNFDTSTDSIYELDLDQASPKPFDLDSDLDKEIERFESDCLSPSAESVLEQDLQQLGYELEPTAPDVVLSPEEVQDFLDSAADPDVLRGLKAGIESGLIGVEIEEDPGEDEMRLSLKMP